MLSAKASDGLICRVASNADGNNSKKLPTALNAKYRTIEAGAAGAAGAAAVFVSAVGAATTTTTGSLTKIDIISSDWIDSTHSHHSVSGVRSAGQSGAVQCSAVSDIPRIGVSNRMISASRGDTLRTTNSTHANAVRTVCGGDDFVSVVGCAATRNRLPISVTND